MKKTTSLISSLFLLQGFAWIIIGIYCLLSDQSFYLNQTDIRKTIIVLILLNAVVMIWIAFCIFKQKKWAYRLSLALLVLNLALILLDKFGIFDLLFVILNLSALILLVKGKSNFDR